MTIQITTLGELADALKQLAEAEAAHTEAERLQEHSHRCENPHSWAMRDADVHNAAADIERLRETPVQVAALLPAELCEAMRAQAQHAAEYPGGEGSFGHAQWLSEQCAEQWAAMARGAA